MNWLRSSTARLGLIVGHNTSTMKLSRMILSCILLIPFFNDAAAQVGKRYSSKEEDAYYDSLKTTRGDAFFTPVSIKIAKEIPYDFIKVTNVNEPALYNSKQVFSAYWDSIMVNQKENMTDFSKFDSVMQAIENEKIGGISKMSIIKQERLGDKWAILYADSKYDNFIYGGWGYWIALSENNGKSWKHYYTGLTENCHYFFKRNSVIPLWKDSATIQIESAVVRQVSEVAHPRPAEFELIQDSIAILMDISSIIKDSDNDGLTDIVENKMMLNPNNTDSDGDGIIDSADKNPRYKSVKTDKSIIYEALMDNFRPNKKGEMDIDLAKPLSYEMNKEDSLFMDFESVYLLITDDKELQGLNFQNSTMIIMTSKEYEGYKFKYPSHFIESNCSKMYKCDKKVNTFKINTFQFTGGLSYIVRKTKKGWKIRMLSCWIS
jgi:hypothetical protein